MKGLRAMLDLHLAVSLDENHYWWSFSTTPTTDPPRRRKEFSSDILAEVAAKHGLRVADLKGPCRERRYVYPRHEAMWALRQRTRLSLPQIGNILGGRDHTTVLYGVRKHAERMG